MKACPNCSAQLDPQAAELGLVHCEACGVVSMLEDLLDDPSAFAEEPEFTEEPEPTEAEPTEDYDDGFVDDIATAEVMQTTPAFLEDRRTRYPMPSDWSEEDGTFVHGWFEVGVVPLVLFTVVWNLFMVFMVMSTPGTLCMPHVWVGLGMAYLTAATIVNRTVVREQGDQLVVEIGPLPWWGAQQIPVNEIAQLYVKDSGMKVNKQPRFHLMARLHAGREVVVLRNLKDADGGKWLEAELEERFGIVNTRVPGEER